MGKRAVAAGHRPRGDGPRPAGRRPKQGPATRDARCSRFTQTHLPPAPWPAIRSPSLPAVFRRPGWPARTEAAKNRTTPIFLIVGNA